MASSLFPSIPRNGGVFLGSLFFATVIWFLFYFSKDYSLKVWVPVRLLDTVSFGKLEKSGIHPVYIQIHGRGWLLTQFNSQKNKEPIYLKGDFRIRRILKLKGFLQEINNQLPTGIHCEEILSDSIVLRKIVQHSKKVPLQISYQVSFQKQYYYSNQARIYPDSVLLLGPDSILKKIHSWKMSSILLNSLNHSVDTMIRLSSKRIPEVRVSPEFARINIHVDRFTENLINLPIKILNNEEGRAINLLPSRVEITYLVPLSYYFTVREDLFEAQVDLNEWKKNPGLRKLRVNLIRSPDFIRIVRKNPAQVDFLIFK